jgi:hypothetical protein
MQSYRMKCPRCGASVVFEENLLGQAKPCPKCKGLLILKRLPVPQPPPEQPGAAPLPPRPLPEGTPIPEAPAAAEASAFAEASADLMAGRPPSPPAAEPPGEGPGERPSVPPPAVPPEGDRFPERMKANRALAGRICPRCQKPVDLGDDVFNCPKCLATMHMACREAHGGCASPQCSPPPAAPVVPGQAATAPSALQVMAAQMAGPSAGGPSVACRFCGEMIPADARKCRFCGEYQSDADRQRMATVAAAALASDKLTTWDIVFGVLCSGIACIVGIVWAIQGKKKGWKLILLSICMQVVWLIVRLVIEMATRSR